MKKSNKYCPDLTSYEERQGYLIGSGMIRQVVLNACLKEECVAFKNGYCYKYNNVINEKEYERSQKKEVKQYDK